MSSVERIIPVLVCEDIEAEHDFLIAAFDFESGGIERDGAGNVVHGEVHSGDFRVWLHRVTAEHQLNTARQTSEQSSGLVVHVRDVDGHFARARAAGARIDEEPVDQPYGQREYGARDLEGHRWWFATPIAVKTA